MTRGIGIFGGTFDPVHVGHLAAVEDAAARLQLECVLFVPNHVPPHKRHQVVSDAEDRVAMVELAIADNPRFDISLLELERPGPSYTLDTLRKLRKQFGPDADLYFLVGCDALGTLHTWHEPAALLKEFRVVFMDRPTGEVIDWAAAEQHFPGIREQVSVVDVAELEISGEDIRRRVREGRPIRYYVLPAVRRYIEQRNLYRVRESVE
jgi:nicotinate-nucleotide adenylyltransferase